MLTEKPPGKRTLGQHGCQGCNSCMRWVKGDTGDVWRHIGKLPVNFMVGFIVGFIVGSYGQLQASVKLWKLCWELLEGPDTRDTLHFRRWPFLLLLLPFRKAACYIAKHKDFRTIAIHQKWMCLKHVCQWHGCCCVKLQRVSCVSSWTLNTLFHVWLLDTQYWCDRWPPWARGTNHRLTVSRIRPSDSTPSRAWLKMWEWQGVRFGHSEHGSLLL